VSNSTEKKPSLLQKLRVLSYSYRIWLGNHVALQEITPPPPKNVATSGTSTNVIGKLFLGGLPLADNINLEPNKTINRVAKVSQKIMAHLPFGLGGKKTQELLRAIGFTKLACFISYFKSNEKPPFGQHLENIGATNSEISLGFVISMVNNYEEACVKNFFGANPATEEKWREKKISFYRSKTSDGKIPKGGVLIALADTINDVITKGNPVYVHCLLGHGRSALVVAAYLIKYHGMAVDAAIAHIKSIRPEIKLESKAKKKALSTFKSAIPPPPFGSCNL
jgi:hypothetical protein